MTRSYERLDVRSFGAHALRTGDLDPVYIALHRCANDRGWDRPTLDRWLLAYWCFYHCGTASFLAELEAPHYWEMMHWAAKNTLYESPAWTPDRWPRGKERRHFRGQAAIDAVNCLRLRYGKPEDMVAEIVAAAPRYEDVAKVSMTNRLFGPWISFKVCDMVDRCLGIPIDFTQAAVFMFDDPVKAALMLWRMHHKLPEGTMPKDKVAVITEVVDYLTNEFRDFKAPPQYDRPVGLQEVETVLCKWKSHMNGHYPLDNDIHEIREGMQLWLPHSQLARDFLEAMPDGKDITYPAS